MCTSFAFRGKDLLYGYSLDIDPAVWNFSLKKNKNIFTVVITVGKTAYYSHGVNSLGHFANVPYMNGEKKEVKKGLKSYRIDLLCDRYLRNKLSFEELTERIKTGALVDGKDTSLHSLFGDENGNFMIAEPYYGYKEIKENYAILTNFPTLVELKDFSNPFYGKDRYDRGLEVLKQADENFSVSDAIRLLNEVKQEGQWGTKISFVYSRNENKVYYFLNGDHSNLLIHSFE